MRKWRLATKIGSENSNTVDYLFNAHLLINAKYKINTHLFI